MDKAILVGLDLGKFNLQTSFLELKSIASALGIEIVAEFTQKLTTPNIRTYVGSGKLKEIKEATKHLEISMVIFDDELSPTQIRNLEKELDSQIIDRSFLILSIFTERAKTKSAVLEVSLAQQKYLLPRLVGMRSSLSRQGGGSYNAKGPGETKLELDRRLIVKNIAKLERSIDNLNKQKAVSSKSRRKSQIPIVSLVGYTNAGKSATLNALIAYLNLETAPVYEENILFATLDTTARKITKKGYPSFVITDTIGFLSRLPHEFINSFRTTLSEIVNSDLILHITDGINPEQELHKKVVTNVLDDLGCKNINTLNIYSKLDLLSNRDNLNGFWISNVTKENTKELLEIIYLNLFGQKVYTEIHLPYNKQNLVSVLNETTKVISTNYHNDYIQVITILFEKQLTTFHPYIFSTKQT